MQDPKEWSDEEGAKWDLALAERMASTKCDNCGSDKVTKVVHGYPYWAFYDWAQAKNEELGWTATSFGGCIRPHGGPVPKILCVACDNSEK